MERHREGSAVVVPVILRPVDWHSAPFGTLKALPGDGKPVVKWSTLDDAFLDVVQAVRQLLGRLASSAGNAGNAAVRPTALGQPPTKAKPRPRSGTLSLVREFTDRDRDNFLDDAFA